MGKVLKQRLRQETFPNVEAEALLNILVASHYIRNDTNQLCNEYGLTSSQFNVLRILRGAYPEGYARCEIIHRMVEPAPDVTRLVDRLVDQGYVERNQCPEDGRKSIANITDKGRKKIEEMDDDLSNINQYHTKHLTKQECKTLSELCEKIYKDKVE